jgi:hypothetical protein
MGLSTKITKLLSYSLFRIRFPDRSKTATSVLVHISSINPNRRLLQIVTQLLYCGYICYLDIPFHQYIQSDISGRTASLLKGVYSAPKNKNIYSIIVSDSRQFLDKYDNTSLKIYFNLHIFKSLESINQNDLFYPIVMYRKFLFPPLEKDIYQKALQSENRKIAAVFIGNIDLDYNDDRTKKLFNINTRKETFSAIKNIPADMLYEPHSLHEFLDDIESGILIHKIVLLNTNDFSIPSRLWFNILLKSSFFIYMCGYIQPYCHNQIESMLAGCIPITQFNRFFIPRFDHESNALLFNTIEDMISILTKIAQGKYDSYIPSMRKSILAYYQCNYSFSSFKEKISFLIDNKKGYAAYHIATGEDTILDKLIKQDSFNRSSNSASIRIP